MSGTTRPGEASKWLDYLPAVFREDAQPGTPNFLGRFLLAFEEILRGRGDPGEPGLMERVGGIVDAVSGVAVLGGLERYAEPGPLLPDDLRAPSAFLEWLSGWVAITLRADIGEQAQRQLIARAVQLYQMRGTRRGLEVMLGIYTVLGATVTETIQPLQVGVHSTVGIDTAIDGGGPHFFRVLIRVPTADPAEIRRYRDLATAIIEREKPAHCSYALDVDTPHLQIGVHSSVGVDTLL
jgi:phage tail-like protein